MRASAFWKAVTVDRSDFLENLVERFPHGLNVVAPESKLRVHVQTDSRYFPFVERASKRHVLDIPLPVAALADILQGKVWAATDETRPPSKRCKDLLDIERILEQYPELRGSVPPEILARLS
jgi:Nucleotidyl transferase AbiEii toxin, Type IV TA system